VQIEGIPESDVMAAEDLVETDKKGHKIIELPYVVESDTLEGRIPGEYRTISIRDFKKGKGIGYILDVDPKSFEDKRVSSIIGDARTIFVNAVMGFTPHFTAGSEVLDRTIDQNREARKLYGGGDTLQEFKNLCPGLYLAVLDDAQYYFFTGGGSVLKAIQEGSPYGMEPIRGLIENGGKLPK